jgi:hypothetical protein
MFFIEKSNFLGNFQGLCKFYKCEPYILEIWGFKTKNENINMYNNV